MAPTCGSQYMPSPPLPSLIEQIKQRKIKQEKKLLYSWFPVLSKVFPPLKHLLVPLPQEKSFLGDPHFLGEGCLDKWMCVAWSFPG